MLLCNISQLSHVLHFVYKWNLFLLTNFWYVIYYYIVSQFYVINWKMPSTSSNYGWHSALNSYVNYNYSFKLYFFVLLLQNMHLKFIYCSILYNIKYTYELKMIVILKTLLHKSKRIVSCFYYCCMIWKPCTWCVTIQLKYATPGL